MLCNLDSVARNVGAPRIVPTRGIAFPTGDPSLPPDEERAWRRTLLETALHSLSSDVRETTMFPVELEFNDTQRTQTT